MLAQMRERDAEQVGGGFNASDQQQDRHVEHFAARQMFAIDLRLDEAADQVFAGIGGALVINLLEIGADRLRDAFDLGQSLRAVSRAVAGGEQIVHPLLEVQDRKSTRLNSSKY